MQREARTTCTARMTEASKLMAFPKKKKDTGPDKSGISLTSAFGGKDTPCIIRCAARAMSGMARNGKCHHIHPITWIMTIR